MTRQTQQRDAIWEAFQAVGRPMSPAEVLEHAQQAVPGLGMSTVYRNLRRLEDEGLIVTVHVPGEADRYETAKAAEHHHHHFHCESCGKVYDIEGCPGGLSGMLPEGFKLSSHEISMSGLCSECAASA